MSEFTEKTVIITGAGSGIGKATALAFGKEGAKVVAADINLVVFLASDKASFMTGSFHQVDGGILAGFRTS